MLFGSPNLAAARAAGKSFGVFRQQMARGGQGRWPRMAGYSSDKGLVLAAGAPNMPWVRSGRDTGPKEDGRRQTISDVFSTRRVQYSKQLCGNANACWKRFSAAPFHSTGTRRCSHEKNMSAGDKLDYATAGADDLGAIQRCRAQSSVSSDRPCEQWGCLGSIAEHNLASVIQSTSLTLAI